jgi:hypothetical protein
MSPEARARSFDELAKGLANGTISRRQALRWMGGALAGAEVASLPGVAFAAAGGNTACDAFCHQNFSGRQAGNCTRAGARGTGPCFECTTAGGCRPSFTKPSCTGVTGQSYNCSTCKCECPSGQVACGSQCCSGTCVNGTCIAECVSNGGSCDADGECCSGNCSNGFCCASGRVGLSNGTCAMPCPTGSGCVAGCTCDTGSSGNYCGTPGSGTPCNDDDSECPTGEFCARGHCTAAC